ncbi:uncharacterized protein LTR77_007412 [Saxophila tyrrhenica]|uniref:Phospholipase n=1 Tax=Saxophila tyrrhenica TaxID=1690608 RepID=A0AAV9P537_9PEZI|nr:hypothetical protein LTR77_007412 [Saxophila tyrrhenica]
MSFMFDKMKGAVSSVGSGFGGGKATTHAHSHHSGVCSDDQNEHHHLHRFQSFAPQREGNSVKWHVDGAAYMWAVSVALEQAQHEIWILDWWLSPELYLRRPPAKNEQYRLDKMLFAAAKRGVKIHVIVYKEVTQALTLSSYHTKHWLEDNDPTKGNIKVFRHPDHLPDQQTITSDTWQRIKQSGTNASKLASLPGDALKGIYGVSEGTVLYWAHHEKLCAVDGKIAFMGGLDLCYGRWDTNDHPIADAHPGDLDSIVFPGQDYNNARIMDFSDVSNWQNNKLDRKFNSRMGWSDVSISLRGPVVEDLRAHFAQRWNYIYFEKYSSRDDPRYHPIVFQESRVGIIGEPYQATGGAEPEGQGHYEGFKKKMEDQYEKGRKHLEEGRERVGKGGHVRDEGRRMLQEGHEKMEMEREKIRQGRHGGQHRGDHEDHPAASHQGGMNCQIMRSCCEWSHGVPVEHSIANAYIDTITNSEHFVYIENQFFITATAPEQTPVHNKIGGAIADRIIKAAKNREQWQIIIAMPSVPAFAGDLKADDALGTRAIMEFQYNSINRGGHSIMEKVAKAGFDPMDYIRFYNLRNYDRIHTSEKMKDVERKAGVNYEDARQGHDQKFAHAEKSEKYGKGHHNPKHNDDAYDKYQEAAKEVHGGKSHSWDSVSSCYMLDGEDIRKVPWDGDAQSELDAFVSEELYIHSKLLIADDRKVICGSANLNDRSQMGSHDSEIAILVEDQDMVESYMAGKPWRASKFATSLRRQIFRKHLGLIPAQDYRRPDANFFPIGQDPNKYDWGSREDQAVADPVSPSFLKLWKTTARNNTEAFRRVFHPVPDDSAKNWKQYDDYYEKYFKPQEANKEKQQGKQEKPATWKIGHVVKEEFSQGEKGLHEVKEILSRVRGTLVEMPLMFLKQEDIAKEGLSLNSLTEEVYT